MNMQQEIKQLKRDLKSEKMLHSRLKKKIERGVYVLAEKTNGAGTELVPQPATAELVNKAAPPNETIEHLLGQIHHYQALIQHTAAVTRFRDLEDHGS